MMLKTFILVLNLSRKCCTSSLLIFLLKLLVYALLGILSTDFRENQQLPFIIKIKVEKHLSLSALCIIHLYISELYFH